MKKLIRFEELEYRKAKVQSEKKLDAWYKVAEEVEKLITMPSTKQQNELLMSNPLDYVTKAIESVHRPNINIPVSTEKLFEMLEIDLAPLKKAIEGYSKLSGKLVWINSTQISTITDKEKFMIYAETEKEIKRLDASTNLIDAFNGLMELEHIDFPNHQNYRLHELRKATGNIVNWENGELIPNAYWIKS